DARLPTLARARVMTSVAPADRAVLGLDADEDVVVADHAVRGRERLELGQRDDVEIDRDHLGPHQGAGRVFSRRRGGGHSYAVAATASTVEPSSKRSIRPVS